MFLQSAAVCDMVMEEKKESYSSYSSFKESFKIPFKDFRLSTLLNSLSIKLSQKVDKIII